VSNLSDIIEGFIKELMNANQESAVEIQRNILAQQFDCSPSQINYVLTTRFNNDRGYIIESRRGGGGYVRILKVNTSRSDDLEKILSESIGESITLNKAYDLIDLLKEKGIVSRREESIMKRSLSERAFNKVYHDDRNKLRADILKEMILSLFDEEF
jgi:transcriptional regulator CtsR